MNSLSCDTWSSLSLRAFVPAFLPSKILFTHWPLVYTVSVQPSLHYPYYSIPPCPAIFLHYYDRCLELSVACLLNHELPQGWILLILFIALLPYLDKKKEKANEQTKELMNEWVWPSSVVCCRHETKMPPCHRLSTTPHFLAWLYLFHSIYHLWVYFVTST